MLYGVRYQMMNPFMPRSCTYSRRRGRIVCEQGVRYASSVGPSNYQDLLRGASVGSVPILVLYRVTFSTALLPRLQLRNLHWPVSVESVGDLHSQVPMDVHFPSHLLPS